MLLTMGLMAGTFVAGLVLGDLNKPSVDRAIAALQAAEASAAATLARITAHKGASTTVVLDATPPTTPPAA